MYCAQGTLCFTHTHTYLYVYNSPKSLVSSHFTGQVTEIQRSWEIKPFKYTWSGSGKAKMVSTGLIYAPSIFPDGILPGTRISQVMA